MVLSNTATPVYYEKFREAVINQDVFISREVEMEMNRIDRLIDDSKYYYDDQAVEGFIAYCEGELTLTDGSNLKLLPTFKLWAEQIFGWWYYKQSQVYQPGKDNHGGRFVTKIVKRRLVTKQYLIVARGAAKSIYESCLQSYFLNVDVTTTQQITTAPTMKQAEEVMLPIRTSITRARGPLFKFLTEGSLQNTTGSRANRVKLASTKKGIENNLTGSILEIRPMSVDKLQGARPKCTTIDEWLSGDVREDVIGAIEQGADKVVDWLIVAVSSEGTVRNGVGDTVKMELQKILKGEYEAPHISIWHYKLDSVEEVADPAMWIKANPNLGRTISYEAYHLDVERAEQAPANRNDILAKRFGIPMEGKTYFFTYEETLPGPRLTMDNQACSLGADLSQGDDFTAFTFLFPRGDVEVVIDGQRTMAQEFAIKTRSYITELTLFKLPAALRAKYEEFIAEDTLFVMDGTVLDMMEVYEDLDRHILECGYTVNSMGYDPYNADKFVDRWKAENTPFGVEMVRQGTRTETVPLGELKKLSSAGLLLFDETLMQYTMGNAVILMDNNGGRKLAKQRRDEKIDNVAALMNAYVAYKANKEMF